MFHTSLATLLEAMYLQDVSYILSNTYSYLYLAFPARGRRFESYRLIELLGVVQLVRIRINGITIHRIIFMYLVVLSYEASINVASDDVIYCSSDETIYLDSISVITSIEYKSFATKLDFLTFCEEELGVTDYTKQSWSSKLQANYKVIQFEGSVLN